MSRNGPSRPAAVHAGLVVVQNWPRFSATNRCIAGHVYRHGQVPEELRSWGRVVDGSSLRPARTRSCRIRPNRAGTRWRTFWNCTTRWWRLATDCARRCIFCPRPKHELGVDG